VGCYRVVALELSFARAQTGRRREVLGLEGSARVVSQIDNFQGYMENDWKTDGIGSRAIRIGVL
jgi:hypothetical protein